jgi:hypothetical protein
MTEQGYKEWGIVVAALLLSFLEFFGIAALVLPLPTNGAVMIMMGVLSIIWLVVMALAYVLANHPASSTTLIILPAVFVVLAGRLSIGAWGGAILMVLSLVVARQYFLQEIRNRINYSNIYTFRYGSRYLVVGLILAIAGLALPSVQNTVTADGIKISEKQVEIVLNFAQPMIKQFVPSFSANENVDQFIDAQITEQLGKLAPGMTIPTEQRVALRAQIAQQLQQQLTGQESMASVITRRINDILASFTRSNTLIVSLVVIVLVFLTIRAFVPLIVWPLIALIALTVWISNAVGLSKISSSQVTTTRLEL